MKSIISLHISVYSYKATFGVIFVMQNIIIFNPASDLELFFGRGEYYVINL